jgi:hypothetical protein
MIEMIKVLFTVDQARLILIDLKNDMIVMRNDGLYHLYSTIETELPIETAKQELAIERKKRNERRKTQSARKGRSKIVK